MGLIDPTAQVHRLALVEDSQVGARTRVWQFASVIRGARLGEDCTVASGATLDGCWFGDRCIISQNVAMGPGFLIGDDVFIGPNVTICNDMWPATHKRDFEVEALRADFVAVSIRHGACIGANAVVLPGVTIGKGAVVAAGAVARRSVPPDTLLRRNGSTALIEPGWREMRMREARC